MDILRLSKSGLHFTYTEFLQMPSSKRLKFLKLCKEWDEAEIKAMKKELPNIQ